MGGSHDGVELTRRIRQTTETPSWRTCFLNQAALDSPRSEKTCSKAAGKMTTHQHGRAIRHSWRPLGFPFANSGEARHYPRPFPPCADFVPANPPHLRAMPANKKPAPKAPAKPVKKAVKPAPKKPVKAAAKPAPKPKSPAGKAAKPAPKKPSPVKKAPA